MQIQRSDIEFDARPIGQGSFKTVFKGMLRVAGAPERLKVAVLKIRQGTCATESRIFLKLGRHPRLVRFMGQCTDGNDQLLLTEFAEFGSLSDAYESFEGQMSLAHLLIMMQQICQGMEHLVSERVLHRDLSSRNVLLFAFRADDARSTSVKVSDFGLAVSSYNRSCAYGDALQMPTRYMPPEALQRGRFSEKSDVWAFGVTAWEMLSGGLIPYFELTEDRFVVAHVCSGGRPPRGQLPGGCPDPLWRLVEGCWADRASDRPTFAQLLADLGAVGFLPLEAPHAAPPTASPAAPAAQSMPAGAHNTHCSWTHRHPTHTEFLCYFRYAHSNASIFWGSATFATVLQPTVTLVILFFIQLLKSMQGVMVSNRSIEVHLKIISRILLLVGQRVPFVTGLSLRFQGLV